MLACKCDVPCESHDGMAVCLWTKPEGMSMFDYNMNIPLEGLDYWERLYIALDVGV
jgi:hypothetical protein